MKCADRVWIVLGFLFCSLGSAGGSLRLAEDNIDEIVRQMSPREKAMLLVGCESFLRKIEWKFVYIEPFFDREYGCYILKRCFLYIIRINHFEYTELYLYIRLLSRNDVLV